MKIALVIGHRSKSQGAYGNMMISEYLFYKEFMEELIEGGYLTKKNKYQVFERTNKKRGYGERMRDLHTRIDEWGADISVSLHFNASVKPSVTGHEILYCSKAGEKLARKLDSKLDKYLDNRDRNLKKRTRKQRGGGFLCRGKSTCILVEPFFASSQHLYVKNGVKRDDLLSSVADFLNELS